LTSILKICLWHINNISHFHLDLQAYIPPEYLLNVTSTSLMIFKKKIAD
jgi:hypothetical protein